MITVSLCMIVRDEQDTLARCLASVEGIVDETVVVDTGSVDDTKAVAATCGARVFDFPWIDDFGAARNHSFDQAVGDYILWLDADDVLLPDDRQKLLSLKASLDPSVEPVVDAVSMLYNIAFDAAGNPVSTARRLRLVKRSRNFRWAGVVHEDLRAEGPFTLAHTDITVTHQKPVSQILSTRNLEIYENQLRQGRTLSLFDVFNYARELQLHHRFAEAIPFHQQFLDSGQPDLGLTMLTLHNIATCNGDPDQEWQCTLRSLELDAPRPEFACRMAERFLAKNQFRQAAFWYRTALDYEPDAPSLWSLENQAFRTWLPHKQLGLCYFQLGDYPRSLHHNREARQYLPDDPAIASNIALLESLVSEGSPQA